ncbi:MAG TPA: hypothetical protein VII12_00215 [Thermoanaerobaculia bacterium]|jgi:hypothetical protein
MVRQHAAALAFFVLLAVGMTWPLGRNLDRAVANPGDPFINIWILDWDWYATFHQPARLFDANIFFPARYALAFSENLYGIALVLFPLRAAGVTPIAAYSVAVLIGFAFCGFAAYLLGWKITGSPLAGIVAGIFYAFVPFRFTHLSHVQHVWAGTLPLLIVALIWYSEKPTWPRAAVFAAIFFYNGLCNIHWLLFGSLAVIITAAIVRPRIFPLTTCAALAALCLLAFLQPYFAAAKLYGMHRSWGETMAFSALPQDWLACNLMNRTYTALRRPEIDPERWLFPGALSVVIGSIGALVADQKWLKIAGAWILLGFFGSLGLHTVFHRFLYSHVIGFDAIRVPARWAAIAYVGLAILVALGAAALGRRRVWAYAVISLAFLAELRSAPIPYYMALSGSHAVDKWLAENRPRAVIEMPMTPNAAFGAMLRATTHHAPLVNGISGFSPPEYERLATLADEWSDRLIPELRRIGVSHVIVHADAMDAIGRRGLARILERKELAFVRRFDASVSGDWLFALDSNPRSSPELEAMLRGQVTRNESTFGAFFSPAPDTVVNANTPFYGFAFSPYGIREVNLLVNNGAIRLRTELRDDAPLERQFHWYPATTKPKFVAQFGARPAGVWSHTDIQPEIVDGRGTRVLLEDRWISWP